MRIWFMRGLTWSIKPQSFLLHCMVSSEHPESMQGGAPLHGACKGGLPPACKGGLPLHGFQVPRVFQSSSLELRSTLSRNESFWDALALRIASHRPHVVPFAMPVGKMSPNGSVCSPNGSVWSPNGSVRSPNGSVRSPNGSVRVQTGQVQSPKNGPLVAQRF